MSAFITYPGDKFWGKRLRWFGLVHPRPVNAPVR